MIESARQALLAFIKSVQDWNDGERRRFQTTVGAMSDGVTLTFGYGYYDRGKVFVERYKMGGPETSYAWERAGYELMENETAVEEYLKSTFGGS